MEGMTEDRNSGHTGVVIVRGAVSPILAPAKLAQYNQGRSWRHLHAEFPELRKRY
jgi:hypothetical protein